jgi:hypothetical protein
MAAFLDLTEKKYTSAQCVDLDSTLMKLMDSGIEHLLDMIES